jgi:uncharacterized protein
MHLHSGQVHLSPTDLVNFLGCAHCTVLDLGQLNGPPHPRAFSDTDALLVAKGREHERAYLGKLRAAGKAVTAVSQAVNPDRVERTAEAMRAGADVIYQASLAIGRWNGFADFLVKTDRSSALGPFSYEALDTKLARHADPTHVIQLGVYSDLLGASQGAPPEGFQVVLGDGSEEAFRVRDFAAYVGHAQHRIALFLDNPPADSYPRPCRHCARCDWRERCADQWEQDDRLNLVANIQRSQVDKLERAGIATLTRLAETPADTRVPDLNPAVFDRLRAQAVLQLHKRRTGENRYELIAADAGRGFARLPRPSDADLFFDMEGDPLYPEGLEYLFGVCFRSGAQLAFRPFWAHDHDEERDAFQELMSFLDEHLAAHPGAFIYHYNHYEPTALKRLASRYAVAERQLDNLLRGAKFVDLYKVVREAVRVSEPSYSLKNLETFYMPKRKGGVATGGDSIVVYNRWRVTRDPSLLDDIAAYNEVDCRSTGGLRDWLLNLRPADVPWFEPPRDETDDEAAEEREENRNEREALYVDYQNRLREAGRAARSDWQARLADLLGFHAREAKPEWWEYFDRMDRFPDELIDDAECLAGLVRTGEPQPVMKSLVYAYRFPPQETKRQVGEDVVDVATGRRAGTIEELDEQNCQVKLKLGARNDPLPHTLAIGPKGPLSTEVQRGALYRVARAALGGTDDYPAVRQILAKAAPLVRGRRPGQPIIEGGEPLAAITEAVANLDRSYLFIQGPPGAGKTYTSAHVIVQLLRRSKGSEWQPTRTRPFTTCLTR